MRNRHGWRGRVFGLTLLMALAAILLPASALAQPPKAAPGPQNVTSRFNVRIGGYTQLNITWDEDESDDSPNNLRRFAAAAGTDQVGRETLRWTAFRTRLFLDVRGPEVWGARTRAYIESDFDGFRAEDSATHADTPRLRRAFAQFSWPTGFELLIGQDNLLITSAVGSESEASGVTSGSRGDITGGARGRQPQIQARQDIAAGPVKLRIAAAVSHNGTDRQADDNLNDSGARADFPAFSGLGQATISLFGRDAVFAVSGYYAEEKFIQVDGGKAEADVNNEGIAFEALIPLGPVTPAGAFEVRGNYFTGKNMARWNLGNNAGVTTTDPLNNPDEISSDGWWAEFNWETPLPGIAFGGGYGRMEDDRADLVRTGGTRIEENEAWWAFVRYTTGPFMIFVQGGVVTTTRLATRTLTESETDSAEVHFIARYRF